MSQKDDDFEMLDKEKSSADYSEIAEYDADKVEFVFMEEYEEDDGEEQSGTAYEKDSSQCTDNNDTKVTIHRYKAKEDIDKDGVSSLGYAVPKKFKRKNIRKAVRATIQGAVIIFLTVLILIAVFDWEEYVPVPSGAYEYDDGFITLSYFGVDRSRKETLIDNDMLEKHLEALKASGYVTITQQDIIDYYKNGKNLPEKALYLVFEDGRRDSSLFAQPILEKVNYKASMMTYAEKFVKKDSKFLQPEDLTDMQDNSFWELGTNGYRFQYINVFDRYENYVGQIDQDQYNEIADYMEDDYNHYLMDFIRDENRISIETREQMEERLVWDYNQMDKLYNENIGMIPGAYIIMHANGLDNDSNEIVRNVNFREAKRLFNFMYTREGESLSKRNDDMYNLTRMEVLPYWQTNHLLMRIKEDTGKDMSFVLGEQQRAEKWEVKNGVSEFDKNNIILTSPPNEEGLIKLSESGEYSNFEFSAVLGGNVIGEQTVYIRSDDDRKNYISLRLKDNIIYIERCDGGAVREIKKFDLREAVDKPEPVSDDEMRKSARVEEQKLEVEKVLYKDEEEDATSELKKRQEIQRKATTVSGGSPEYIPKFSVNDIGERLIRIKVKNDTMSLYVNDIKVDDNIKLGGGITKGFIMLGAKRSEINERDTVYDAVFTDLFISDADNSENVFFDTRLKGKEKAENKFDIGFQAVIDWFIENL